MEITSCITPAHIAAHMDVLNSFGAVVLDANLSPEAIEYAAQSCTAPLYADPVSTAKAVRLLPVLDKLTAIKPNIYEAEKLTGEADPERAACALIEKGVRRVFISLGEEGMLAAEGDTLVRMPREFVTAGKQKKLRAAASLYLSRLKADVPARFDVAEVYTDAHHSEKGTRVEYIEDAF